MPDMTDERWSALSEQLGYALELSAAQRTTWLATLEERDAELAARVRAALAAGERAGFAGFLQDDLLDAAGATAPPSLVGRRVGAYVIDEELGEGGMGSVWRAHRADGRYEGTVAIKFVHGLLAGRAGEQRFRNEGDVLARLNHPNIARLMDAGVLEGMQPYLVLEYVEGQPIDAYCEAHGLGLEQRLALFVSVLEAVTHAHSHLIVHRDIKPANVFVTREGVVKLLDFGIAKLLRTEAGAAPLTQLGATALTPQYAAPEQVLAQEITTATDVYALGLVLYVLLAGRHPLQAGTRSAAELLHAVVTEESPRPSTLASLAAAPGRVLAGDLDNIVGKALKKHPGERYVSAAAFADDLRRFLRHEPVQARPDSFAYRAGKFVRRHRLAVVAASLASLVLMAATAFALWQAHRATLERDQALLQARRADSVGDFLSSLLGDLGKNGGAQAQHDRLDRARALLEARNYEDPNVKANLLNYLSARYEEFGYTSTAAELLQEAKTALRGEDDPVPVAQLSCGLANLYDDLGREDEADREIRSAMSTLESLGSAVRLQVLADCRLVASYVATARRENRKAIAVAQRAVTDLEAGGIHSGMQLDTARNALARADAYAGHNAEAVRLLRQLRAGETAPGQPQTIGAWIHGFNEARDLLAGGRVLEAERLARDLSAAGVGGDSTRDVSLLRAESLLALDREADAGRLLDATPGAPPDASLPRTLQRIEVQLRSGARSAAQREWADARAGLEQLIAAGGADAIRALRVAALLALDAGDVAGADAALARAAALAVDADGQPAPGLREVAALRADVALQRHLADAACGAAQLATDRARSEAVDPASSAWIGEGLLLRARCEQARGQDRAARTLAAEAVTHLEQNLGPDHPLAAQARALSIAGMAPAHAP